MKIAVIGLGNVGEEVLKEISKTDKEVLGVDIDDKRLSCLKDYNVSKNLETLPDIYLITLYSTEQVMDYVKNIDYCNSPLIIIESTINPGSEKELKKIVVDENDSNLVFCPHRLNPGDKEHQVFNLKRLIAGATDDCLKKGLDFYTKFMKEENLIITRPEYALLSKVLENSYRFTEITIAEEIKLFCDDKDLDFDELRRCMNSKWNIDLKEAREGIGGKCLPKDIKILNEYFKDNIMFNSSEKLDKKYKEKQK